MTIEAKLPAVGSVFGRIHASRLNVEPKLNAGFDAIATRSSSPSKLAALLIWSDFTRLVAPVKTPLT